MWLTSLPQLPSSRSRVSLTMNPLEHQMRILESNLQHLHDYLEPRSSSPQYPLSFLNYTAADSVDVEGEESARKSIIDGLQCDVMVETSHTNGRGFQCFSIEEDLEEGESERVEEGRQEGEKCWSAVNRLKGMMVKELTANQIVSSVVINNPLVHMWGTNVLEVNFSSSNPRSAEVIFIGSTLKINKDHI